MGAIAPSRRFLQRFAIAVLAAMPAFAQAAATAQGVALNAGASCSNANLDLTLTTSGATREFAQSTNAAGGVLFTWENSTQLGTYSGTYSPFLVDVAPVQPAGTVIGSYAYIGETPPAASNTAEFFVLYNCTTRLVLMSCYGPYGTCPQTAQQALAPSGGVVVIPTLTEWALALTSLLLGATGVISLGQRRGRSSRPPPAT